MNYDCINRVLYIYIYCIVVVIDFALHVHSLYLEVEPDEG